MLQNTAPVTALQALSAQGIPLTAAGQDTRRKVMAAAQRLMWLQGYGAVSVDHICAAAGVKKGSFYHVFDSKEALALALFEHHWEEDRAEIEAIFDPALPTVQQLARLVDGCLNWQQEMYEEMGRVMGCPWFDIGQEMGALHPHIRAKAQDFCGRYRDCHVKLLRRAQHDGLLPMDTDIVTLASVMWASVTGLLAHAKLQNDLEILRRELPALLVRFVSAPDAHATEQLTQTLKSLRRP